MKRVKMNYRQKSIAEIMKSKQMGETQATSYYNKMYREALKSVDRSARSSLNVARELYASNFAPNAVEYVKSGMNVFELDSGKNKVVLNKLYDKSKNIGYEKTTLQMDAFYQKFKDSPNLVKIFNQYKAGTISRTEFNQAIKDWKQLSIKYMISGSR